MKTHKGNSILYSRERRKYVQRKVNMKGTDERGTVEFSILNMWYEFPCTDRKESLSNIMVKQMPTLEYHIHA